MLNFQKYSRSDLIESLSSLRYRVLFHWRQVQCTWQTSPFQRSKNRNALCANFENKWIYEPIKALRRKISTMSCVIWNKKLPALIIALQNYCNSRKTKILFSVLIYRQIQKWRRHGELTEQQLTGEGFTCLILGWKGKMKYTKYINKYTEYFMAKE